MKQLTIILVCIAVLTGSILLLSRGCDKTVDAPEGMWMRPQTLIDNDTLEVITLPLGEWGDMNADGAYRNRETGDWTMVLPLPCPHCNELVPPIVYQDYTAIGKERAEWTCPKCGKRGF